MRADTVGPIVDWIHEAGLVGVAQADLVAGYCERLAGAGVPVWRASIGAETLHPLIDAQGHRWFAGEGVRAEFFERSRSPERQAEWLQSPWSRILDDGTTALRRNVARGEGTNEFALLAALAAQGATDYWARIVRFGADGGLGQARGIATSWATRRPEGFAEGDLALIEATLPAFAVAFKASLAAETARTLVATYLGRDAGERILRGEIERGRVETVPRVLWFSDLTDFTRIADELPREQLIDLLNVSFDCLVEVVHRHDGEVLKFMGDSILAVFAGDRGAACGRALDAAFAARAAMAKLARERRAAGLPVADFTLALHEGEVLYGNVGSRDRLDFTVIGPAVNEVSRIEAMCRSLDRPVLVSAAFTAACKAQRSRLVSLGRYALRGVGRPQELFTLDEDAGEEGGGTR